MTNGARSTISPGSPGGDVLARLVDQPDLASRRWAGRRRAAAPGEAPTWSSFGRPADGERRFGLAVILDEDRPPQVEPRSSTGRGIGEAP